MSAPVLNRKLTLEAPVRMPDGAGGYARTWAPLGVLWAEIRTGTGREAADVASPISRVAARITVRAAPFGAPSRPKPEQRFREGQQNLAHPVGEPHRRCAPLPDLSGDRGGGGMTFAASAGLQTAVYTRLMSWDPLTALVGAAIYDALPSGSVPAIYVALGAEESRDRSDMTGRGAEHDFVVSVVSDATGFAMAKQVAAAVCDALIDAPLALSRGTLVALWFRQAKASRTGTAERRQVDLTFRARTDDGETA